MSRDFKTLAVIPARGNSQGIPRKNLQPLGGLPLVAVTIRTALAAGCFDRIIVSTDDAEIAEIAVRHGAEVPFLRPRELSGRTASPASAERHVLAQLAKGGFRPDFSAMLYPTHPFRRPELLRDLVQKGREGCSPVITVRRIVAGGGDYVRLSDRGEMLPVLDRQDAFGRERPWFRSYGIFSGSRPGVHDAPYFHVLENRLELIDIDTYDDLALANAVIREGLFDFGFSLDREGAVCCASS